MEMKEIFPKWKQNMAMELYWTNVLLANHLITEDETQRIKEKINSKYKKEEEQCSNQSK